MSDFETGFHPEQEDRRLFLQQTSPEVFDTPTLSELAGGDIENIDIVRAGQHRDGSLEKYVVRYESPERNYFLSFFTHHDMRRVHRDMRHIHDHMPASSVPRPVAFLEQSQSVFYEEVPGDHLLKVLGELPVEQRGDVFRRLGERMRQFHDIPSDAIRPPGEQPASQLEHLLQTVNAGGFEMVAQRDPAFLEELRVFYDRIVEQEKKLAATREAVLNHGDLHPENVIVGEGNAVGVMDLTDVMVAPRAKDIGGFFAQMRVMMRGQYSREEIQNYEGAFLEGYGNSDVESGDIQFYRAWQQWRTALYNATKSDYNIDDARRDLQTVEHLLADVQEYADGNLLIPRR